MRLAASTAPTTVGAVGSSAPAGPGGDTGATGRATSATREAAVGAWGEPSARSGAMRVIGPLLGVVWLVFLLQPWQAAWAADPGWRRTTSLAAVAALAVTFAWVVTTRGGPRGVRAGARPVAAVVLGMTVLVALASLAAREDALVGLVFLSVAAILLLRSPSALLVPAAACVLIVLVPRLVPGWATIDELTISVVLASVAMFGFTQLVVRNRQLLVARDEVAVLAVERERERIARDMHDILGHSLTVISVKAELAGRLLDVDGDRARTEILEVHALARSALADVRAMVSATRAVTLAGELAGARHAFDAAGIEAEVPGALDDVPEALRDVFAWAVREGTTNILRHAAATRARITVAPDALTIDDDGPSGIPDSGATPPAGNGLGGLVERARAAGARVETSRGPLGGFRLRVTTLPPDGGPR